MHYYLYEIKNNINGKIYVGAHSTKNLHDGYFGSGKALISAIQKYGKCNFTKTILETFTNSADMYKRESEIVTDEFLLRNDVYNLKKGGFGGFDHINNSPLVIISRQKGGFALNAICKSRKLGSYSPDYSSPFSNPLIQSDLHSRSMTQVANDKRNESFKRIGHQIGEKNSQFGSIWITDGINNAKINKNSAMPDGWHKGRVIKNSV